MPGLFYLCIVRRLFARSRETHIPMIAISYFYSLFECFNGDNAAPEYIFLDNFSIIIIT